MASPVKFRAPQALEAFKKRVREITSRDCGGNIKRNIKSVVAELREYPLGWKQYFRLAGTRRDFRRSCSSQTASRTG
jgi:hypothetical protein